MNKQDMMKLTMDFLIEQKGFDVNSVVDDGYKNPLLAKACWRRNEDLVRALIAAGADVNSKDKDLWTPLHYAALTYNMALCKILIDAGADVNAITASGDSVLHRARNNKALEDFLKSHGAVLVHRH